MEVSSEKGLGHAGHEPFGNKATTTWKINGKEISAQLKIYAFDLLIVHEFLARPFHPDLAVFENIDPLSQLQGETGVLLNQENCDAGFPVI